MSTTRPKRKAAAAPKAAADDADEKAKPSPSSTSSTTADAFIGTWVKSDESKLELKISEGSSAQSVTVAWVGGADCKHTEGEMKLRKSRDGTVSMLVNWPALGEAKWGKAAPFVVVDGTMVEKDKDVWTRQDASSSSSKKKAKTKTEKKQDNDEAAEGAASSASSSSSSSSSSSEAADAAPAAAKKRGRPKKVDVVGSRFVDSEDEEEYEVTKVIKDKVETKLVKTDAPHDDEDRNVWDLEYVRGKQAK